MLSLDGVSPHSGHACSLSPGASQRSPCGTLATLQLLPDDLEEFPRLLHRRDCSWTSFLNYLACFSPTFCTAVLCEVLLVTKPAYFVFNDLPTESFFLRLVAPSNPPATALTPLFFHSSRPVLVPFFSSGLGWTDTVWPVDVPARYSP